MRLVGELSEREILLITSFVQKFRSFWETDVEPCAEELQAVGTLSNDLSAHYLLLRSGTTAQIFRAEDTLGTIIHSYPDGLESIPFYPAACWATSNLVDEYPDVSAVSMELNEWDKHYLEKMSEDGIYVELFPQKPNAALLVKPETAKHIISGILSNS